MKPTKNPAAVALGKLGGKAGTGDSKRRKVTSEQARAAVNTRWAKYREKLTTAQSLAMIAAREGKRKKKGIK